MLTLERKIIAFAALGEIMLEGAAGKTNGRSAVFTDLIDKSVEHNPWFTPDNVRLAVEAIGESLSSDNLKKWISLYPELSSRKNPGNIGVVMAGNIPLVGFHDLLSVLISGHRIIGKLSSKDEILMRAVADTLIKTEPQFNDYISLTTGTLSGFDAVIATGSDNTSRYFEYYFRGYPSIIRHNRNSIAVLDGSETDEELRLLGHDIFSYFGLGCRNISKLYLPENFDINRMLSCWNEYEKLREHQKYAANYDHNKAVMIVNRQHFTDSGFILVRCDSSLTPPMAVLNYELYDSGDTVKKHIQGMSDRIQCVTGHGYASLGSAQHPFLWEYADDIDTIDFLLNFFLPG